MEITVDADEAHYLTYALKHAIKRVEKHAKKVNKVPDGGGAYCLTMRDDRWNTHGEATCGTCRGTGRVQQTRLPCVG
jgi:DnaJ-class molecular chaperone